MSAYVPGFEANAVLGPFIAIAVAMVVITIVVLGLVLGERRPPLLTQLLLTFAVVGGGTILLLALVFAFINPDGTDAWTWVLMAFNFMMAVPVGLWFVALIVYRDRRVGARDWGWPLLIAAATTGSEVLMGVLFAVGASGGSLGASGSLGDGLSSVWYFWSMAAVMGGLLAWASLRPAERAVARGLLATALLAPWVAAYPLVGGLLVTAAMTVIVVSLVRLLLRRRLASSEAPFLLGISGALVAMTLAGLLLVVSGGSDLARIVFGTVMGLVMTAEIAYLVRACYGGPRSTLAPESASSAAAAVGSAHG